MLEFTNEGCPWTPPVVYWYKLKVIHFQSEKNNYAFPQELKIRNSRIGSVWYHRRTIFIILPFHDTHSRDFHLAYASLHPLKGNGKDCHASLWKRLREIYCGLSTFIPNKWSLIMFVFLPFSESESNKVYNFILASAGRHPTQASVAIRKLPITKAACFICPV